MARRKSSASPAETATVTPAPAVAKLKPFIDGGGKFEDFSFARWFWVGDGPREGLAEKIMKKRCPVPPDPGSLDIETAAKTEFIAPARATAEFISLQHFLQRYEQAQPQDQVNSYVQLTFSFPHAFNLHHPFEMVRAFICDEFVNSREMPVFLAAHAPWMAASLNPGHVHAMIFPVKLDHRGFSGWDHKLPSDAGNREVHDAWIEFRKQWALTWPAALLDFGIN